MKKTNIIYWILTGLFAFVMLGSAVPDILISSIAVQGFTEIGMPTYLLPFLGIAKLLGVIAILVPGYARIKEWAYAGLMYDLIGATYSVAASGKPVSNWSPMLIFIVVGACSYIWYHKKQKARLAAKENTSNQSIPYKENEKAKITNAAIA